MILCGRCGDEVDSRQQYYVTLYRSEYTWVSRTLCRQCFDTLCHVHELFLEGKLEEVNNAVAVSR